jgi:phage tail-like protein
MPRVEPLTNSRFRIEIDGISRAGFCEVSIAETTTDAVDYREGTDPPHLRKLPGLRKFSNITLKVGLITGANALDLFQWYSDTANLGAANNRRNVSIIIQDEGGRDVSRFHIAQAWPTRYSVGNLNARGHDVLLETIELVNEGIVREA